MGEKVQGQKNEGEKKAADKKADGKATAVFMVEMNCKVCAKEIRSDVRRLDGVEDVKTDCAENKLTVTGKANPAAIKERLEQKTKKKVKLVSTQPEKDGGGEKKREEKSKKKEEKKKVKLVSTQPEKDGGGEKKREEKSKKKEEKKKEDKKPQEKVQGQKNEGEKKAADKKDDGKATAVFMVEMNCKACAKEIRSAFRLLDGVEDVKTDCAEKKLTVTGKANPAAIKERLDQKTKKKVKLVSMQLEKDGGGEKTRGEKSKKKEEKKKEDKKPQESTPVLKIRLEHCILNIENITLKVDDLGSNGERSVKLEGGTAREKFEKFKT